MNFGACVRAVRPPRRRATLGCLLGLGVTLALPGCATKNDLKNLRDEILTLQARQDSLFHETQRQNHLLLDTLRASFNLQLDARGETSHRFQQLGTDLARVEEMLTLTQQLISQLNDRLNQEMARSAVTAQPAGPTGPISPGQAEPIYQTGLQKMQEGSFSTARTAFQEIVTSYPDDARAPDAQFQIAETYYAEQEYDQAMAELEKVERMWPRSPRAPAALLRAGVIAQEQKQDAKAREYFQQVKQRYPSSDEAGEADRRLRSLR